jgi:hypothetical protein
MTYVMGYCYIAPKGAIAPSGFAYLELTLDSICKHFLIMPIPIALKSLRRVVLQFET